MSTTMAPAPGRGPQGDEVADWVYRRVDELMAELGADDTDDDFAVLVGRVQILGSVGIGYGSRADGTDVRFIGDWREMRDLGVAIEAAGEAVVARVTLAQLI